VSLAEIAREYDRNLLEIANRFSHKLAEASILMQAEVMGVDLADLVGTKKGVEPDGEGAQSAPVDLADPPKEDSGGRATIPPEWQY
jgi:hypothetical protein